MSEYRLERNDAVSELAEINRRQAGVIQAVLVPRWYWWVVGLLLVLLGVVTDSHQRLATALTAVAVALIIAALSVWMISGVYRGVRIHSATLGSWGAVYIVGFVWLLVGATLAVAFSLQAEGIPDPATLGTLVAAAMLIAGGPILMSRLRRAMVEHSPAAPS
jgi:hypothetical protein